MELATWGEFKQKVSDIEKKASKAITDIKEDHPLLDSAIQGLISNVLPPPINNVALNMYNNASESEPKLKFDLIMDYLKKLEGQGEKHYNSIIKKLSVIISGNEYLKGSAKEQIKMLQDIIINQEQDQQTLLTKLDEQNTNICKMKRMICGVEARIMFEPNMEKNNLESINILLGKTLKENEELKKKPQEHIELLLKQATAYFYTKQYGKMYGVIESVLQIKPNNVYAINAIALYYYKSEKNYDVAIIYYDKAIAIKPDFYVAWSNRGISLNELGRYDEAIESFNKAIEINPDDNVAWYNRGNTLDKLGQYKEAIESFNKAIEIKSDDDEAWYNRGISLNELGRYDEAIESFNKAIEINPNFYVAWLARGISLNRFGQYKEAIESFNKAIEIKSDDNEVWGSRGIALAQLGQYKEAIESFNKTIAIKLDDDEAWYNRGISLIQLGQYKEAIESFNKTIAIKPKHHEAWDSRGVTLIQLGQYKEAIESFNKAIEINPEYHATWYNRGVMLVQLGRYQEAKTSFKKALDLNPTNLNYQKMVKNFKDN